MTQSDYRNSVKCKYCTHFRSEVNRCKRGGYSIRTDPNSVCKSFMLPPADIIFNMVTENELQQRGDGSYITSMPEFMRKELEREERKEDLYEWIIIAVIVGIGLWLFWLIFGPFITGICEIIFGILDFLS